MNDEELQNVLQQIWANWMFRLSLSSNELFHSNTMQYLAQCVEGPGIAGNYALSRDAVIRFLGLLTNDHALTQQVIDHMGIGPFRVLRESHNTDIKVVRHDNRPLFVVEIKVKSFPIGEQLVRYGEVARANWNNQFSPPVFLLSLVGGQAACTDAAQEANLLNFRPASYGELANRLDQLQLLERAILIRNEYVALCHLLQNLADKFGEKITPELTLGGVTEVATALRPFRLDAIWSKLWISFLKIELRNALPQDVQVASNFTNNALVEGYWQANSLENPPSTLKLGVELEGNSLRLFINIDRPGGVRRTAERALLRACAKFGLFRNNPRYPDYVAYWNRNENFWNNDIDMPGVQEQGNGRGLNWPRNTTDGRPRLHGYEPGFADFRIPLNPNTSLSDIVCLFVSILTLNNYSAIQDLENGESLLKCLRTWYANDPQIILCGD